MRREAQTQYEQTLAKFPRAGVAANNLAWLYVEAGRLDEALQWATVARREMPRRAEAHDTLGWMCCSARGLAPSARSRRPRLRPVPACRSLAFAYSKTGAPPGARQLRRAIAQEAVPTGCHAPRGCSAREKSRPRSGLVCMGAVPAGVPARAPRARSGDHSALRRVSLRPRSRAAPTAAGTRVQFPGVRLSDRRAPRRSALRRALHKPFPPGPLRLRLRSKPRRKSRPRSRLVASCLSGCFSKPLLIVYGRGAPALSEECAAVSASVRDGRGLPRVSGSLSLARWLHLSSMRAPARLRPRISTALAMRGLPAPGVADGRDDSAQHEDPADALVLGGVFDDHG